MARRKDGTPFKAKLTGSGRAYNLCRNCYGLSFTDPASFVENLQREDTKNGRPNLEYSDELEIAEAFYKFNPQGMFH